MVGSTLGPLLPRRRSLQVLGLLGDEPPLVVACRVELGPVPLIGCLSAVLGSCLELAALVTDEGDGLSPDGEPFIREQRFALVFLSGDFPFGRLCGPNKTI